MLEGVREKKMDNVVFLTPFLFLFSVFWRNTDRAVEEMFLRWLREKIDSRRQKGSYQIRLSAC